MNTQSTTSDDWITAAEARRRLRVSPSTFRRLVEEGRLGVLCVPGAWPRASRHDVDSLLSASTRAASASRLAAHKPASPEAADQLNGD